MSLVENLGYAVVGVSDQPAWDDFLVRYLGLMNGPHVGGGAKAYRIDDYTMRIATEPSQDDDLLALGFEVKDADELFHLGQIFAAKEIEAVMGDEDVLKRRMVDGLLIAADPDGNRLEFFHTARRCPEEPFCSPRLRSQFVTGSLGLGHAVLATSRIEEMRNFYCEVLGFEVSDYIDVPLGPDMTVEAVFLHCNPRHHTIALLPAPLPKRLVHLMLEVESVDDVGRLYDQAESAKVPVTGSLGRHSNDRMLSFYVATPSEFELEFGCDGRLIDEETWVPARYASTSIWGHGRTRQ